MKKITEFFGINTYGLLGSVITWLFLCNCSATSKKAGITGIKITSTFPRLTMQGKLLFYDTNTTSIYYYNKQVIYHSSYNLYNKPKDILMEKPDEVCFYYFVFTNGMKYGYYFDKKKGKEPIKLPVDSVLKKEWSNRIDIVTNFKQSNLKLINKIIDSHTETRTYLYSFVMKSDSAFNGTISYHFDKTLNKILYSFSKEHDSTMQMKLSKIEIINNSRYLKEHDMTIDKVEQFFFLEKINMTNEKELLKLFEKEKLNH